MSTCPTTCSDVAPLGPRRWAGREDAPASRRHELIHPALPFPELEHHSAGLVCLSGCARDGAPIAVHTGGETRFMETLAPGDEWTARNALLRSPLAPGVRSYLH